MGTVRSTESHALRALVSKVKKVTRRYGLAALAGLLFVGGGCVSTGEAQSPLLVPEPAQSQESSQSSLAQSLPSDKSDEEDYEEEMGAIAAPPLLADPTEVAQRFAGVLPASWGTDVPGVVSRMDSDGIALTLDACGGPGGDGFDQVLIDGLIERNVPATLFLNKRWIDSNPDLTRALAKNPLFEVANHGSEHRPLSVTGASAYGISGTTSVAEVVEEVWANHVALFDITGEPPRFFRSGTAHYDEVAVQIVSELGERVVGFSVNADAGATFEAAMVREQVATAEPGSIVIAHMNRPEGETAEGILAGIDDQLARGQRFAHLEGLR